MNKIVGIIFKENGKAYFFDSNNLNLSDGNKVVVETERGLQLGTVVICDIKNKDVLDNIKPILRIATDKDIKNYNKNLIDASKALIKAKSISKKLNLNMNVIESVYTLDRNQLIFYFLSDIRVDFRDMAKELASIYKTRIELRQIGVRDKAKTISGIGQCGRELCCSSFLNDFMESVSINMAKNQNIALNPNKINGQCGRLLCCLNYEDDVYSEHRKDLPNLGDEVQTDSGKGKVVSLDILNKTYTVNVPEEGKVVVSLKSKCDECGKCSK